MEHIALNNIMSEILELVGTILLVLLGLLIIAIFFCLYFSPFIIAYKRRHAYKWVILGLNIIGFAGLLPWIVAFIWAAWPSDKSLIDPLAGNVTGKGLRNSGDTLGSAKYGLERGYREEQQNSK